MSGRYIALVGCIGRALRAKLREAPGLSVVFDSEALLLGCGESFDRIDFPNGRGTIIGTVFERGWRDPISHLDAAAMASLDSDGSFLVEPYWGSYVAFLAGDRGRVSILRDPSGAVACYVARSTDGFVITSDVRLCISLGLVPGDIDWEGVAAYLLWPERRTPRTCLSGIRELMPGSRLVIDGSTAVAGSAWQPWQFTSTDRQIDDQSEAAELLRMEILSTMACWCSRYPRPLVSLSGGLDSSIVTAGATGLAGAVTIRSHEALGDERKYARAVADRCSVALLDCSLSFEVIEPRRSNAARLPRPVSRLFGQALDRIWDECLGNTKADALFHGGGGDNVFCYLSSAAPYLDTILTRQPRTIRHAVLDSLSRMTRVSHWQIRRAALRKQLVDCGRYHWIRNSSMLTVEARRRAGAARQHPWFERIPAQTLPGKQAHVAALVRIQNYLEAIEAPQRVPVIAPLLSQPIVETCLRIPTWMWCRDGMNRVVARDAFRDRLPAEVIDRRSKGSPAAFEAKMVAWRRRELRDLLRHGHLAARGFIDMDAVGDALGEEGSLRGTRYLRVTELVDVEAWLQSWIGLRPSTAAQS